MKKFDDSYIIHFYFKKLKRYSEQVKKNFDKKAIHLFRVTVKKLRAYLRMQRLKATHPGELKFPSHFKKLYSLMGKIRDRQLYLERIKKVGLFNEVTDLEKEINKLRSQKKYFLNKNQFDEIEKRIVRYLPPQSNSNNIEEFILQKTRNIQAILSKKNYSDKDLHNIRKNIKDIIYIIKLLPNDVKFSLPAVPWNEDQLKDAESFAQLLGLFNDSCIELSFSKPATNKNTTASIRHELLAQKRKLKKDILNKLPELKFSRDFLQ